MQTMFVLKNQYNMKNKIYLLSGFLLLSCSCALAQNTFYKSVKLGDNDYCNASFFAMDKGFIITGATKISGQPMDATIIKTDKYFNISWAKTISRTDSSLEGTVIQIGRAHV